MSLNLRDLAYFEVVAELGHLGQAAERLGRSGLFARTVTLKAKRPDFTILSRSLTLSGATDRPDAIARIARGARPSWAATTDLPAPRAAAPTERA